MCRCASSRTEPIVRPGFRLALRVVPVVALACLATAVWGQAPRAGDVISTTAAPGGFIAGIAWDGEHL